MCVCLLVSGMPYDFRKRQWSPGARVTENFEPPDLEAGHHTQVPAID